MLASEMLLLLAHGLGTLPGDTARDTAGAIGGGWACLPPSPGPTVSVITNATRGWLKSFLDLVS